MKNFFQFDSRHYVLWDVDSRFSVLVTNSVLQSLESPAAQRVLGQQTGVLSITDWDILLDELRSCREDPASLAHLPLTRLAEDVVFRALRKSRGGRLIFERLTPWMERFGIPKRID